MSEARGINRLQTPRRLGWQSRSRRSATEAVIFIRGRNVSWGAEHLDRLDAALGDVWMLGRNVLIGWLPAPGGLDVLSLSNHALPRVARAFPDFLSGSRRLTPERAADLEARGGFRRHHIAFADVAAPGAAAEIDQLVTRYAVIRTEARASVLLDITGFSLNDHVEQVALLNSLAYSLNIAHSRALALGFDVDIARSPTGDGFYVWNRHEGVEADLALYSFTMLALTDNAIGRAKGATESIPRLRACFHVGSHYEFFQAIGLNPGLRPYICGDLTIHLARMSEKALPGQILVGRFARHDDATGAILETPQFMARAAPMLEALKGLTLSGDRVTRISAYLTGNPLGEGRHNVLRYTITGKHQLRYQVFNAKVNIHRGQGEPIFLGLRSQDLGAFNAAAEPVDSVDHGLDPESRPRRAVG